MAAWSGLGMNYGNDFDLTEVNVASDLDEIKAAGITKIRIAIPGFLIDSSYIDYCHNVIAAAQNRSLETLWGLTAGATTMTSSNWSDYSNAVKVQALWGQNNGLDAFCIGNELEAKIDGSTLTAPQLKNNLRTLATECQAIFTRGRISYAVSQGNQAGWITENNLEDIDDLTVNVYGSYTNTGNFKTKLTDMVNAFGERTYITEWNLDSTWSNFVNTDEWETREIAARQEIVKDSGVSKAYFFTWRMANDEFSVQKEDGAKSLWWNVLSTNNGRRYFINRIA